MGTDAGIATRRYHGLLVAALRPPTERAMMLSRLEETAIVDGVPHELSASQYPGAIHPRGDQRVIAFDGAPIPTWVLDAGAARIGRRLFMVDGEQTVVLRWSADRPVRLRVAPMIAFRDYHALRHEGGGGDGAWVEDELHGAGWTLTVRDPRGAVPPLRLHHDGGPLIRDGGWWRDHEYAVEAARGLDFREDLWRVGAFDLDVDPQHDAWLVATIDGRERYDRHAVELLDERRRRKPTGGSVALRARALEAVALDAAAEQFVVRRGDGSPTIIAGYPWFTDWGRDTMIALPGLLVDRGRLDEARAVIRGFLGHLDRGIIPNRFPDRGEAPEYNNVDGTLHLFQAARAVAEAEGSLEFVLDEVYPAGKEIVRWHLAGTHHGIRVDPADGLLVGGDAGTQLTWMDARVDGRVVTPRHGKPVEIQALWHDALALMGDWARAAGEDSYAAFVDEHAARARRSFGAFWNPDRGCLFDVLLPDGPDPRVRPNQLFALALSQPLVDGERARSILAVVERELLTPFGLRTLAPGEGDYIGRYRGGVVERDGAYHQGAVWPWLIGPYVRAALRVRGGSPEALARLRELLAPLLEYAAENGTIPELFDGDAPHLAGGAPAQAWSVAEVIAAARLTRGSISAAARAFNGVSTPGARDAAHPG
jgi:predicted glycogen debranching enzyme